MAVYQLKDGRWIVQYRKDGKYKREYFGRGLQAESKARARNDSLGFNKYERRTPEAWNTTFEGVTEAYLVAKHAIMEDSTMERLVIKLTKVLGDWSQEVRFPVYLSFSSFCGTCLRSPMIAAEGVMQSVKVLSFMAALNSR